MDDALGGLDISVVLRGLPPTHRWKEHDDAHTYWS